MNESVAIVAAMKDAWWFKVVCAACITAFTSLYGGDTAVFEVMFILVMLDLVTGVMKTAKKRTVTVGSKCTFCWHVINYVTAIHSRGLKVTIKKFLIYFCFIIAAWQTTRIIPYAGFLNTFTASIIAVTEFVSVLENLSQAGLIIPKWFMDKLHKYLDTGEFK